MNETERFYDDVAETYDSEYGRPVDLAEDALTHSLLKRNFNPEDFVLDVGCGTGFALTMMEPHYYIGVDLSQQMLERAREAYPDRKFIKGDMHDLPWQSEDFDMVICLNSVANYTEEPELLVMSLRRATRSRCLFSVALPPHANRPGLAQHSPGLRYYPLKRWTDAAEAFFGTVRVTTYSSWLHDHLGPLVHLTGVRCPMWLNPYYAILEAHV